MSKHYDVVVLGSSVGALACAALLARRSWRVLVVGHGAKPARYRFGDHALARRTFAFLAMSSPAFARVLVSPIAGIEVSRQMLVLLVDPTLLPPAPAAAPPADTRRRR